MFELLYVFLIAMAWTGIMAGNSFFNTQLFATFFSTTHWRFSKFSCGFRSKAENCRNGLSFKKAFTVTAHHLSLNKLECSFTLYKYFVNYTPRFKSKLFSIISKSKNKCFQKWFFCFKTVFIFLIEWKRRELKSVKKDEKLSKEKIFWQTPI